MEFHVITDTAIILLCTVEGRTVTIPGEPSVVDSPDAIQATDDKSAAAGNPGAHP